MSERIIIQNATIINEGNAFKGSVTIEDERIAEVKEGKVDPASADKVIDGEGKLLLPGAIDDQVHFREPGMEHKEDIASGAETAVSGGITSYMEMPNTKPPATTVEKLEEKYDRAKGRSAANFSFFMGASNDNIDEVLKVDPKKVCGVKAFMGSSTGDLLVDDDEALQRLFSECGMLIAAHCEDETTIKANEKEFREAFGEDVPIEYHPVIRSHEACFLSSSKAVRMARQHGARLHVLHISTLRETDLFDKGGDLNRKRITSEACVHHLWFTDEDYKEKGTLIKWNPAVKTREDRDGIFQAMLDDKIDVIATDHAPHTLQEKQNTYFKAPSGGPLLQHSLVSMLEHHWDGKISLEKIVEKMAHAPAILFGVEERGFIREGYFADLVLVDPDHPWTVSRDNVISKCGWSPFEGYRFRNSISHTFVNGHLAYYRDEEGKGVVDPNKAGKRLTFDPR